MRKSLGIGLVVAVVCALAAAAAPFSGSWSFRIESVIDPFEITKIESVLDVDYSIGGRALVHSDHR